MGFEPTTASLEGWNSTTELRPPVIRVHSAGFNAWFLIRSMLSIRYLPASILCGGQARIRTLEADGNRFTVCPLWPLGYLPETPCTRHNKSKRSITVAFFILLMKKEKQAGPRTAPPSLQIRMAVASWGHNLVQETLDSIDEVWRCQDPKAEFSCFFSPTPLCMRRNLPDTILPGPLLFYLPFWIPHRQSQAHFL